MEEKTINRAKKLPDFFKPVLWSYNFSAMDPKRHKKTIILNAINYGNLRHWRWLLNYYGRETVKKVLKSAPAGGIRPRVRRLAAILFSVENFNYAPRSIKR